MLKEILMLMSQLKGKIELLKFGPSSLSGRRPGGEVYGF